MPLGKLMWSRILYFRSRVPTYERFSASRLDRRVATLATSF